MQNQPGIVSACVRRASCMVLLAVNLLFMSSVLNAAQFEFDLSIDEVSIAVAPGLDYKVFGFNQQVPGP